MHYFGEPWVAPFVDPAKHVTTPIGAECVHCKCVIVGVDRGFIKADICFCGMFGNPFHGAYSVLHRECHLAQAVEAEQGGKPGRASWQIRDDALVLWREVNGGR